jgi:hypothetical protein
MKEAQKFLSVIRDIRFFGLFSANDKSNNQNDMNISNMDNNNGIDKNHNNTDINLNNTSSSLESNVGIGFLTPWSFEEPVFILMETDTAVILECKGKFTFLGYLVKKNDAKWTHLRKALASDGLKIRLCKLAGPECPVQMHYQAAFNAFTNSSIQIYKKLLSFYMEALGLPHCLHKVLEVPEVDPTGVSKIHF